MDRNAYLTGLFEAWRAGDALRSAAFFGLESIYREARGRELVGRDAIREHFTRFFRDGPRFEFFVDDTLVEGDRAAVRYRFATISESLRKEQAGCAFVTFANGTISEWREYEG